MELILGLAGGAAQLDIPALRVKLLDNCFEQGERHENKSMHFQGIVHFYSFFLPLGGAWLFLSG
jgi:hypothetical protein